MTIGISATGAATSGVGAPDFGAMAKPKLDFAKILENFKKAATQTPAEKARDAVLAKHKLSEDDYQKLPPSERKAIDAEITEAVKRVTERKTGVPLGDQPIGTAKLLAAKLFN